MPNESVDRVADAIRRMDQKEREALLLQLAEMDDLIEDLEDVVALIRSAREPARPYQDFLDELKAERGEV